MSDTQWPRYQVFHQDRPGRPHLNAGSVHAPDPELALLNARDVFVRRPACVSLWVVRADQVAGLTAEELAAGEWPDHPDEPAGPAEPYLVFIKRQSRGAHEHCGEVQAGSPGEALRRAVREVEISPALAYWVCPKRSVLASEPDEQSSWFGPAQGKPYRDQAFYHTDSLLRELKRGGAKEPDGG
jgi:ring-1,2-phenylacetyl-CoA epoxidase subunit PaaB